MICLDTNSVIYLGKGTLKDDIISDDPLCYSSVTVIEALGYPDILAAEEQQIKSLFATMVEIPLTEMVVRSATALRQLKRMSLGDAIIAATALEQNAELWTVNTDDFKHISGLKLANPLKT